MRIFSKMKEETLFIGASRASPPSRGAVTRLAPARELSSGDLPGIAGPKVILGGAPCAHWSEAIGSRTDTIYVVVGEAEVPTCARAFSTSLPAAPTAQLRRLFSHLLDLRRTYPDGLPRMDDKDFCWKGHRVALTAAESALMGRLVEMAGVVVGRDELARIINVPRAGNRALDAHIHRLRQKLQVPGVEVRTERQRGFRLVLL